jgi:phage-related protein
MSKILMDAYKIIGAIWPILRSLMEFLMEILMKYFYSIKSSISSKLILNLSNGIRNVMFCSKYYEL